MTAPPRRSSIRLAFATLLASSVLAAGFVAGREMVGYDLVTPPGLFHGIGSSITYVFGGLLSAAFLVLAKVAGKGSRARRYFAAVVLTGWVAVGGGAAMMVIGGPSQEWAGMFRITAPAGVTMDDHFEATCVSEPGKPDELERVTRTPNGGGQYLVLFVRWRSAAWVPTVDLEDVGYFADVVRFDLDAGGMTGNVIFRATGTPGGHWSRYEAGTLRVVEEGTYPTAGWPDDFEFTVQFACRPGRPQGESALDRLVRSDAGGDDRIRTGE